jgi:hypothetical protein
VDKDNETNNCHMKRKLYCHRTFGYHGNTALLQLNQITQYKDTGFEFFLSLITISIRGFPLPLTFSDTGLYWWLLNFHFYIKIHKSTNTQFSIKQDNSVTDSQQFSIKAAYHQMSQNISNKLTWEICTKILRKVNVFKIYVYNLHNMCN